MMCGIIGYLGKKDTPKLLVDSLKRLEYRGYDSWGLVVKGGQSFSMVRKVGRIGDAGSQALSAVPSAKGIQAGIAHTRWATNGKVTEANAHPHLSNNGFIAVVHNGIIENYRSLKKDLEKESFSFSSECDSEVIPNLIQFQMEKGLDLITSCVNAFRAIEGSYAAVVMHRDFEGLVVARNGSPLVIGLGKDDLFVASDIPAFLEHTNRALYLSDNEMAVLSDKARLFSLGSFSEVEREPTVIDWTLEQAEKGDYPHFMLKEINEQRHTVRKAAAQESSLVEKVAQMIKQARGVFFLGCGTSYHACVSASYTFSQVAGMHVNTVLASEFCNYRDFVNSDTLVFAVSQSGETADLLDAVKASKEKGAKVVAVVNVMGSSLMRMADESIMMNSGPETCVLSTKTYTSQLAILSLLAYSVAGKQEEGRDIIEKAASAVGQIIDASTLPAKKLASRLSESRSIFLIGRELAFPSALEGALKIKEVSYIHAEGFAGGELKHGTIALIEEKTPVIALSTPSTKQLITSNAEEVRSRGAYVIGIGPEKTDSYDYYFPVADFGTANPLVMIIPVQLLAYYLAVEKGLDPDHPRNLAKSCTVR
jgi:glucosamine--fructose-6-phosphate aminotransferase (isomerizing)